jgi:SAM-dependent methyltransferase/transcriptional regulator with XRE-family HTH domain
MTQSELAEKLNLTRQAISQYEVGDSFPDVSILVLIADIFGVTLDNLINSGEPSHGESAILSNIAAGNNNVTAENVSDIVNLAPFLKPNILTKMAAGLSKQDIDISNIVTLAEYLNDESVIKLLENAAFDTINDELLEKLLPFLDEKSKGAVFQKIIDGELDWHMIKVLLPYAEYMTDQIEAGVVEGALPNEVLEMLHEYAYDKLGYMEGIKIFICPKCSNKLIGFKPKKCVCGYEIPQKDSVYQFTDEPAISLDQEGHKYLGYEYVGINYEGSDDKEEFINKKIEDYGIFGSCSQKLVELIGKDCVVLDLGCGLGAASIPLAMYGAKVIAADISQTMLSAAADRIHAKQLHGSITLVRMNGYNLKLADNCVDAVVAIDMLHQVDDPEIVIKEILRVLKPNSVFAQFNCQGLPMTEEQQIINQKCGAALNDIQNYYQNALDMAGYKGIPFSSWDKVKTCIEKYFYAPEIFETNTEFTWTGKMQKGINKLKTRASGSAQLIADDIHNAAWSITDKYAREKYGVDYYNIPGYSRFTGILEIYKQK